jgi:PAS domain S-box-containing protein
MVIDQSAEILRLRATVRDLLALSIIPEAWVAREPPAIAADLADLLIGSLKLDFAFVRLCDPTGYQAVEVIRGDCWKGFPEWLQQRFVRFGQVSRTEIVTNVGGVEKSCCGVVIPIGVNSGRGLIAAACDRSDFPDQIDQQLLSVAANNAATAFQNARLINELRTAQKALRDQEQELRKAHDQLEIKVAERTSELRRSERELRDVIDTIPAIVWSTLPDGSNTYVNKRFVEYSGSSAEQTAGSGWQALIHPDDLERHASKWMEAVATGKPHENEVRSRRSDGQYRWHLDRGVPLRDEDGNIVKWYGVTTDIEDRKRAEEALQQNQFYLAEGQRLAHMGSWAFNPSGFFEYWSQELFRIYGLDPATNAPTVQEYLDRIHPQDREFMANLINRILADASCFDVTKRIVRPDGKVRYIRCVGAPVVENQRLKNFVGTAIDVTEHELLTQELRRREAYLTEAQRLSHTGSFGWTPYSGEVVWSDETYCIFEYDRSVKPSIDSAVQRVHPQDRPDFQKVIADASRGETDFEHTYRLLLPDGRVKHIHALAHALHDASGNREFVGAVTDITERKTTEDKIRRLVEADILGIFIANVQGEIVEANQAFLQMLQYGRQDLVSGRLRWMDLTPAELRERDERALTEALATGVFQPYEKEFFRKDGSRLPVLIGGALFQSANEGVVFVLDLSERKRAEDALRRSESYLAEAQRLSHTGSWAWSPDLIGDFCTSPNQDIRYWSDECYRVLSFDPQNGLPRFEQFFQRIHPDDQPGFRELIQTAIREKAEWEADYRIVHPDGPVRDIHVVGHPVLSMSGHLIEFVGTVIDVTERRRAEQERARLRQLEADLAHTNRVSTLGEMAASLAHEIKQPITAAITSANSCIEWLAHEPPNLDRARAAAARIDKYGNRAAEIIDRIRSFYRKSPPQRELVDVNGIIQEMLTLLKGEATRYSVAMRTELAAELPKIMVDRVQLQQVFMNLMLNAIEAMKDSGGELKLKSELQDGQLQFSVSDTGVGLPTEKMDQIFSAFFTTKPQGSGMGLAISRSIVESHGGRLWATANDGRGATFHFTLPTHMTETSSQVNLMTLE